MSSSSYELPAVDRSGVFLGLSPAQAALFGSYSLLAIIGAAAGAPVLGLFVGGLVVVPLAVGRWAGSSVLEWTVLWAGLAVNKVLGRDQWFAAVPVTAVALGGTVDVDGLDDVEGGGDAVSVEIEPPPCLSAMLLGEISYGGRTIGVVRDLKARTITAMIPAVGQQFALLPDDEKDGRLAGFARVLGAFAGRGAVSQVSWTAVGAPSSMGEHSVWSDQQCDREGRNAEAVASYRELLGSKELGDVSDHQVVVSVTVSERLARTRRRPGGETREDRTVRLLCEAVTTATEQMRHASLTVDAPLSLPDVADVLRVRIDPAGTRSRRLATVMGAPLEKPAAGAAMPLRMVTHPTFLEVDGRFHRTFLVAEWPARPMHAGWMGTFLRWSGSCDRAVTVLFEPVAPIQSDRRITRDMSRLESNAELKQSRGRRVTARDKNEIKKTLQRESELLSGHREVLVVGMVTLSSDTLDELEEGSDELETAAYNSGIILREMFGRQADGWAATLGFGATPGKAL